MNTQQLKCFVLVAEKLNFTKAAEELYISAPAVTHQIKNLEAELNTTLFIRTSRMVKLTETGALFYSEAKDILDKMIVAEKKVKKLASQKLAVLRIGCSSQTELHTMENSLMRLKEEFPEVCPQMIIQDYFLLKSLFDNRQVDIVVATKEMLEDTHDYIFKKIKNIINYAVVSQNSPFALKEELSFKELYDVPLITLHPRLIPFQHGNKLQELIILHGQKHFHTLCEHDQSAVLLAKCGYGVAILPEIYIPANSQGIAALPFTDKQASIEYGIAYHKNVKEKYIKQFVKNFTEDKAI